MGLTEDIELYRERTTRMVGLTPNPPDHSTDNGILFSATYIMLLSLETSTVRYDAELAWFEALVKSCEIEPGLIARYPGDKGMQAHDDLIGAAWVSGELAREILTYGKAHKYSWNTEAPGTWSLRTFFYRMGAFVPYLKARCGFDLNWLDKLNVSASFILNAREPHDETSGRCLLFMMASVLEDDDGGLVDRAIKYWRGKMNAMYSYGVQELYGVYFGKEHPFSKYAPKSF